MKTLSKILLCLACVMLMASCEKEKPVYLSGEQPDLYQVFTADFTVWEHSVVPAGSTCQLTWEGNGYSDCIGSFRVEITLNCNMASGEFCDLNGSFIADDDSELFFQISEGKILPNSGEGCDYYEGYFNDPAEITGGTGQFVYVTGSFCPNAFIHNKKNENDTWFAKFLCEGKIFNFYRSDKDHIYPEL
ncbi:MAG: hypothetical protein K0B37_03180 [Bacteroidales bacterium]|nr:hypothetical protein [Bacteroidales bacterium]